MKRWAWNIFCAVSMGVFAGSVVIWGRSYFVGETLAWYGHWTHSKSEAVEERVVGYEVDWARGALGLGRFHWEQRSVDPGPFGWAYSRFVPVAAYERRASGLDHFRIEVAGFSAAYGGVGHDDGYATYQTVVVPLWVFLLAGAPAVLWWRGRRKERGRGFEIAD